MAEGSRSSRFRAGAEAVLVSVIVPVHNGAATLEETLGSVAAQTHRDIEILIVDDGSTDGTTRVAERFCAREPRARLIRQPHGGVASARNRGIAEARGAWVAPIDSDDLWHPDKLAAQIEAAAAAPVPVGFVYCWFDYVDAEGRSLGPGERFAVEGRGFERLVYRNYVGNGSALLISREALRSVGGYDEGRGFLDCCEDMVLQLRLARRYPVAVVPRPLVGYRIGGARSADYRRAYRSWLAALKLLAAKGEGLPGRAGRWNLAWRRLQAAEAAAWRGRGLEAARYLAAAMLGDPVRTTLALGGRLGRTAAKRLGWRDPDRWTAPLERLDRRRMDRLDRDGRW
jgi:glycosyltransferase involved in cell wall biosynthesis